MEKELLVQLILNELFDRQSRNPRYSLNKLASDFGISRAHLNGVINGKRGLSPLLAQKITARVHWNKRKKDLFVELVQCRFARSQAQRQSAKARLESMNWRDEFPSGKISGMWQAVERIGSNKNSPKFWNPSTDNQVFIFEANTTFKLLVTSKKFLTSTWGHYRLVDRRLETKTESQYFSADCPWADYQPKLAPTHRFQWLSDEQFCLHSDSKLLTQGTFDEDETLVTVWSRIKEMQPAHNPHHKPMIHGEVSF